MVPDGVVFVAYLDENTGPGPPHDPVIRRTCMWTLTPDAPRRYRCRYGISYTEHPASFTWLFDDRARRWLRQTGVVRTAHGRTWPLP